METGIFKLQSTKEPEKILIFKAVEKVTEWDKLLVLLKKGKHSNKRLQDHVSKYGVEDLVCSLMFECGKGELAQKEAHFIERFKPYFNSDEPVPVKEKKVKVLVEEPAEEVIETAAIEEPETEKAIIPEQVKIRKPRAKKKVK